LLMCAVAVINVIDDAVILIAQLRSDARSKRGNSFGHDVSQNKS